ncbi:uncharacterized protein ACRADG_009123 isoform 2-T2 [Cochliomyia hominivorax]
MTNGCNRKRRENKSCPFHPPKKRRTIDCWAKKENFMNFMNTKSFENINSEYLYADPSFIKQTKSDSNERLEGGGKSAKDEDVFYDCYPCENEKETQPQLQIVEVINEIKNPKEFKSLLKQLAYTSNNLYRSFREAYSRCKKSKCLTKKCTQCREIPVDKMARGDMKPMEIVDIKVPPYKKEFVEDVRYITFAKTKSKKKKSDKSKNNRKDEECFCYVCYNCQELHNQETNECPFCRGMEAEQTPESQTCLEEFQEPIEIPSECNKPREFKWFPQDSCLSETKPTNVCEKFEDDLKDLNFCERCEVLRGERPWPVKTEEEVTCESRKEANEKSSQICQQKKKCPPECSNLNKPCASMNKQVLNVNPICLTIPLKLQIDSDNCQSRFIETEIVMEAGSKIPVTKPVCKPKPEVTCPPKPIKQEKQVKSGSDLFYSCLSTSGIIKTEEIQKPSLTEVFDVIKKRMPSPEDMANSCKFVSPKQLEERGIQLPIRSSLPGIPPTAAKPLPSRTDFTQTLEEIKKTPVPIRAPALDPKAKAHKLRSELVQEIRSALEKTTTEEALKALMAGRRFSLPTDLRPKETINVAPVRHSEPSHFQNVPFPGKPLEPLKPLPSFPSQSPTKPPLPPKPTVTPKSFNVTETVQTDASAITPTGHYKRNEMRSEIQEGLKELLEPNTTKSSIKYKPEERDEILLDLYKLFHPEIAGTLPKQISRENALYDIEYIVKPEVTGSRIQRSDSQDNIIQSIRYILNPKIQEQRSKRKKFPKETKDNILEDLRTILKPPEKKNENDQDIRNSVLYDLRFMLDTGQESLSSPRPPRLSQLQQPSTGELQGPNSSRAQEVRKQREQKPPSEIRDSLIADLRYMLDTTQPPPTSPAGKKIHSATSSEVSLTERDKTGKRKK